MSQAVDALQECVMHGHWLILNNCQAVDQWSEEFLQIIQVIMCALDILQHLHLDVYIKHLALYTFPLIVLTIVFNKVCNYLTKAYTVAETLYIIFLALFFSSHTSVIYSVYLYKDRTRGKKWDLVRMWSVNSFDSLLSAADL